MLNMDLDFSLYTLISQQNYVENDEFVISILKSIERHRLITNAILHLLPRPTITSLNINYLDSRRNIPMWSKMLLIMRMSIILLFSRLKTLRLSYCILINSTPVSFHRCFENLTVLELRHVKFPPNSPHWKFGCPLLTTLSLDGCTWMDSIMDSSIKSPAIVIEEAPKLSYFYLNGDFISLQFNCTTPLPKQVFIRKIWLT
ncbi:hypothetical protein LINGRAHAP2_LOCUS32656 [Linum grandiflorum]